MRNIIAIIVFNFIFCLSFLSYAQESIIKPEKPDIQNWSYSGLDGKYDREQLRRGLQVYQEKCQSCHGMKYLEFYQLTDTDGPGFTPEEAKLIAEGYVFADTDDMGQPVERPGILTDFFPSPYLNSQEASYLNNGKEPVDLTYITKARGYERGFPQSFFDAFIPYDNHGSDYVYALLTGYPDNTSEGDAFVFNRYYPGGLIAMNKQLHDGDVIYKDNISMVPETAEQYARDVTAFLAWAADPYRESRAEKGWIVLGYLSVLLILLFILMMIKNKTKEKNGII